MRFLTILTIALFLSTSVLAGSYDCVDTSFQRKEIDPLKSGQRAYDLGDYQAAYKLWSAIADKGNALAMCNIGRLYLLGSGVTKNSAEALNWYQKAAETGNPKAETALADLYFYGGGGITVDVEKSLVWRRKAALQGNARSQFLLGLALAGKLWGGGSNDKLVEAAKWYRKAAEQGKPEYQQTLGSLYARGEGVIQDLKEAAIWYRKSADQGYGLGQIALAQLYERGLGVPKDILEAYKWYKIASMGQYNFSGVNGAVQDRNVLGLHLSSKELQKANNAAFNWYVTKAEEGDSSAQLYLGLMYLKGENVPQDKRSAIKWFQKAAAQDVLGAQHQLGRLYAIGDTVPKDYVQAYKWCNLRKFKGLTKECDELVAKMKPEEISEAEDRMLDWVPAPTSESRIQH